MFSEVDQQQKHGRVTIAEQETQPAFDSQLTFRSTSATASGSLSDSCSAYLLLFYFVSDCAFITCLSYIYIYVQCAADAWWHFCVTSCLDVVVFHVCLLRQQSYPDTLCSQMAGVAAHSAGVPA